MKQVRSAFVTLLIVSATVAFCEELGQIATIKSGNSEPPAAVRNPNMEVREHRLGRREQLRSSKIDFLRGLSGVGLELIIAPDGTVLSAVPIDGPTEFYEQAVGLARTWKYTPFLGDDGSAIKVKILDRISILPPEQLPDVHKEFPRIKKWKSLTISLERTGCFGTCPVYKIEIHGDGTFLYTGSMNVVIAGQHRGRMSEQDLLNLVEAFRSADYFSLKDNYGKPGGDLPTYITSIAFDGASKTILDYWGEHAGMPSAVSKLEETIDRLCGTEKWLRGNAETAQSLVEEGWDFKAQDILHASLLSKVVVRGNLEAVRSLISLGVSVEGYDEIERTALMYAAGRGDTEMVRELLKAGAGLKDQNEKNIALFSAARSGKPEIVRLLLSNGADPTFAAPDGSTVLMFLDKFFGMQEEEIGVDRSEVARMLLAAGANVNAQDNEGNTPLMHVPIDTDVTRIFIEKGANVNARNKKGRTPLMQSSNPATVRMLLESGADPSAFDATGHTVLDLARYYAESEKAKLVQAALERRSEPAAQH